MIFAYHGYPWLIHRLTYRRTNHDNFHVRGYKEEGTTTTPFDMTVLNQVDRFNLAIDVIDRVPGLQARGGEAREWLRNRLIEHALYIREHGEDLPEVRDWQWEPGEGPQRHTSRPVAQHARGLSAGARPGRQRRIEQSQAERPRRRARSRDHDHGRAVGRCRRPRPRSRDFLDGCARPRRRRAPGGARRTAVPRVGPARRRGRGLPRLDRRPRAAAQPAGGRRDPRRRRAAARRCRPWRLRHRRSTPTIPDEAATYALPREWNHRFGLRRYGFHGLSHAYAVRRGPSSSVAGRGSRGSCRATSAPARRCAPCATAGRSTPRWASRPLAGLVMQTRVGSVDPGILLWLLEHGGVDVETLGEVLEHQSGLKGLSGTLRRPPRRARGARGR